MYQGFVLFFQIGGWGGTRSSSVNKGTGIVRNPVLWTRQTWESLSVDTAIVRNPICGHAIQNFQFIFLILVDRSLTSPTARQ